MERSQKALQVGSIDHELEQILLELQKILALRKAPFIPYTKESLQMFIGKPYEMKAGLLHGMHKYIEILKTFQSNKAISQSDDFETVQEDKELIEVALDVLSLKPPEGEDFSFLKQGWVVEIYNLDMIQVYRNYEFFRQCSYDLYTILVNEWHALYERNSQITASIFSNIDRVMKGEVETTPFLNMPDHTLKERYLSHNKIFHSSPKYLTPLFDKNTGEKVAFMNCIESYPIGTMKNFKHL